jgi:hypothetical protein
MRTPAVGDSDLQFCESRLLAFYLAMVQVNLAKKAEHFFAVYKDMKGKFTKVLGWKDCNAVQEITRATRICLAKTRAQINHRLSNC